MMGTIVDFELLYLDAQKRIRALEAELAALRQQQGEPVAIIERNSAGQLRIVGPDGDYFDMSKHVGVKLYREAAPRVPEGWKLVPDVATEEMLRRAEDMLGFNAAFVYQAMLAAAPEPKE